MKTGAFLFFIQKLTERYIQLHISIETITRATVLKMLFFMVLNNQEQRKSNIELKDLLDIFDNFYALPLGPVESDCYNEVVKKWEFEDWLKSTKWNLLTLPNFQEGTDVVDQDVQSAITFGIEQLPEQFFHLSSTQLINKSHLFPSWSNAFDKAIQYDKQAWPMTKARIQEDVSRLNTVIS